VTSYNLDANHLSVFNKRVTDKSLGKCTKNYIKRKLGTINKSHVDGDFSPMKSIMLPNEVEVIDAVTPMKLI